MPKLEALSEVQRQSHINFPAQEHDDSPATPLAKPLSQCKLALVTTAGLHLRSDMPFTRSEPSFRVIPAQTDPKEILQSHISIGFDRTAFYRDINISFPVHRIEELVERNVIGSHSDNYYSFMGAQRDATEIATKTAPQVARFLREEGVDVVLLTPT